MNGAETGSPSLLFVDYENVGKAFDPGVIPEDVQVLVFFGALQKSVPTEFMRAVHRMGPRFVPIGIEGQGKNALDFHLAYYLGEHLAANAKTHCVVLSKDKGFDILIRHLRGRGFSVRRADSINQALPTTGNAKLPKAVAKDRPAQRTPLQQAIEWLKAMQTRTRPRKRKSLVAHLHTRFGKKIPEPELEQIVATMIAQKSISETDGKLAYNF
jgi:PIN domain